MLDIAKTMESLDLEKIKVEAKREIEKAGDLAGLALIGKKYLDKDGVLGEFFKSLGNLSKEERAEAGIKANEIKQYLTAAFKAKSGELEAKGVEQSAQNFFDTTLPGIAPAVGHLHPFTLIEREIGEIFGGMGFEIAESREIETEWYNFDALNVPKDHPARDEFDTLFMEGGLCLRPHTSPGQVRYMENHQPPLRIIVPGRVFRRDAVDASHMPNFYQVEGLMVDKGISVANFKAVIDEFFRRFFSSAKADSGKAAGGNIRLRPSFFPFTEPSFEVDLRCVNCAGKGCSACKGTGWMEVMGAGMVHPAVLKNSGVDPSRWQGFAFGIGMDRLAMIKHKINDIRLFYGGNQRFLNQF
jgi:phenylalanyl-tRNA synthetase alpha chain